ncbi:MAG: flagellar biosynthesis anti-sigma factor FlgM [Pseudomonadota bacterium]
MPNKIDSSLNSYQQVKSAQDRNRASLASNGQTAAPRASDTVDVTASARELASLESAIRAADASDTARVDAVRTRVEDGSYQVDPERVADSLLNMDQALPLG